MPEPVAVSYGRMWQCRHYGSDGRVKLGEIMYQYLGQTFWEQPGWKVGNRQNCSYFSQQQREANAHGWQSAMFYVRFYVQLAGASILLLVVGSE